LARPLSFPVEETHGANSPGRVAAGGCGDHARRRDVVGAARRAAPAQDPAGDDRRRRTPPEPVAHRYVHGVIPDDARFQLALPEAWNGSLVILSRGFSGTEPTTGAWKTTALAKGYAFAASDEGWNRLTIAREPEDSYSESRQRLRGLTRLARHTVEAHYRKAPRRTLMVGGSNGGHYTKWLLESDPDRYDGGIAGYGFNSQVSQWGSIATLLRHYDAMPAASTTSSRRAPRIPRGIPRERRSRHP